MPLAEPERIRTYSSSQLAREYGLSIQQADRYIARFGSIKAELDSLLASKERTEQHQAADLHRTLDEVTFG
ncbi:hypothetical protein [Rhizobium sp. Root482]|uniref:hypothetical protein n=1 Tax=Rhizobium sp. Root482 TaxID=1736543 RepID=UPI0006F3F414|nr:hypothetical protein [Rhizobium sp. Root482]KQY14015.1 hypothetical protein ASD31_12700 [Rhizobium sp. Root482]